MKKFFVGVKGVIIDPELGVLLIKHAIGYWDVPGGRLDDDEDLEQGLRRELQEELPGCIVQAVGEQIGAFRVHKDIKDDISLVIIFFIVQVTLPSELILSDEHTEYIWVRNQEEIPKKMDPGMQKIVAKALQKIQKQINIDKSTISML